MFEANGDVSKLYEAMGRAWVKFAPLKKTATGQVGATKFQYCDLPTLLEATMPALISEGVFVNQFLTGECLTTVVAGHGAYIRTEFSLRTATGVDGKEGVIRAVDAVKIDGAVITYMRRYAYQAAIGVIGDLDADSVADATPRSEPKNVGHMVDAQKACQLLEQAQTPTAFDAALVVARACGFMGEDEKRVRAAVAAARQRLGIPAPAPRAS